MYKIIIREVIEKSIASVYLYKEDQCIESRIGLDYDLAETYIAALYNNYNLPDNTSLEDEYGNITTINKFIEI